MNGETGMANEFGWSNTQRGDILAAFGWGYTLTQIPGGLVSQVIGPKRTLVAAVAMGSVAGLLIPLGSRLSFIVPLSLNFIIGMAQGPLFPVLCGLLARWMRPSEMARGNAMMGAAWNVGQVVQYLLSPILLKLGGWPLAYYSFAGAGLVWTLWWQFAAADAPEMHPRITAAELSSIQADPVVVLPVAQKSKSQQGSIALNAKLLEQQKVPSAIEHSPSSAREGETAEFNAAIFARICCQGPVIVVSICSMLDGLANSYANWLPQYYSQQLDYDLESTGIMVALPMLIGVAASVIGGLAADAVLARGYAVSSVRRWFNFVPSLLIACCTLSLVWITDAAMVVGLMMTANFLGGFKNAGIGPVTMELSRTYAAVRR
jgi:MFS family permease